MEFYREDPLIWSNILKKNTNSHYLKQLSKLECDACAVSVILGTFSLYLVLLLNNQQHFSTHWVYVLFHIPALTCLGFHISERINCVCDAKCGYLPRKHRFPKVHWGSSHAECVHQLNLTKCWNKPPFLLPHGRLYKEMEVGGQFSLRGSG